MAQIILLPVLLVWTYFKAAILPLDFLYPFSIGATLGTVGLVLGVFWAFRVGGNALRGSALLILFVVISPVLIWLGGSLGGVALYWIVIAVSGAIVLAGLARMIVSSTHNGPVVLVGVFILTLAVNSYVVATVALMRNAT